MTPATLPIRKAVLDGLRAYVPLTGDDPDGLGAAVYGDLIPKTHDLAESVAVVIGETTESATPALRTKRRASDPTDCLVAVRCWASGSEPQTRATGAAGVVQAFLAAFPSGLAPQDRRIVNAEFVLSIPMPAVDPKSTVRGHLVQVRLTSQPTD